MAGIIQKLMQVTGKSSDEIMELLGKKGDDIAPAVVKEADEMLPAIRKTTMPVEVGPQVMGKSTSRVTPDAGDMIDAEIVAPKVSTLDAVKEFAKQNKGKIAGGLSLAELSRQMMNGGGEEPPQIPMAKAQPAEPDSPVVAAPEAAADDHKVDEAGIADALKQTMTAPAEEAPAAPVERTPSSEELEADGLHRAQQTDNQSRFMNAMVRSGIMAGSAIGGSKADYSGVDVLDKSNGVNVANFKDKMKNRADSQALQKGKLEAEDEDALNDPNSEISKSTVSQLAKYGINVKTAKQAKQLNPQIFNLLLADRAQANAREVAKMGLDASANKQGKTLDEKQRKFAQGLRKEATTGVLGKQYATYSTGQRMGSSLAQFAQNPSGYKDYATLMGGLKSLQGDESVVREAEMRLGINATSLINKAYNYLEMAKTGKSLQPSQRQEMLDTINILTEASRSQYMQSVAPILEQAEMEGIDPNMILSGSLSGAKDGKEAKSEELTTSTGTRTFKTEQQPGSVVTVKSGKKYKIGQDGLTGTEIP